MDLLNRVSKGVVGVGKAAGQGVVGVGKGVGQGVGKVGKTASQGVTTVGKGVGQMGKAAGAGVVTAAGAGVSAVGNVGKVGVGAVGAVGGTAVQLGKTGVEVAGTGLRTISGQGSSPKRRSALQTSMEIYCSDLYTEDFVLGEIVKARNDKNIVNLHFEDMILRESPEISQAATKLLLDTAASLQELMDDSRMDSSSSRRTKSLVKRTISNSSTKKEKSDKDQHSAIRRVYDSISFTECISSAEDYKTYVEEKEIFQENLLGRHKIRANVPIRFTAKIELHTMLGGDDVKELLKEIQKDEAITGIDFPNLSRDHKKVPSEFMQNFDAKTGEWIEDALSIEIRLRYGEHDNMAFSFEEEGAIMTPQKNPRKSINKCLRRLEGGPEDNDRSERKKRTSREGPKKRVSEGVVQKKRSGKSPPRKCISEGSPSAKRASGGARAATSDDPVKRTSSAKKGTKRVPRNSEQEDPSHSTCILDDSFNWNGDNEIVQAELKPEEKDLVGLTKAEATGRKSGSKKKSSPPKPTAQPVRV